MGVKFEQKLGMFKDRTHLLFWEVRPDMDILEEFVVNISYSEFKVKGPKRIQIVRIDNVGKPLHMDRLWEKEKPKERFNWEGSRWELFSRSVKELERNWRKYAQKWDRNKGY